MYIYFSILGIDLTKDIMYLSMCIFTSTENESFRELNQDCVQGRDINKSATEPKEKVKQGINSWYFIAGFGGTLY